MVDAEAIHFQAIAQPLLLLLYIAAYKVPQPFQQKPL